MASSSARAWRKELERSERILGRIGPDDICCEGLTPRQTSVLRVLAEREGARLLELATAAEITPSAMTRMVEKLERQGFVQRVRGTHRDGRAAMVEITTQGCQACVRIDQMSADRSAAVMQAIPAKQRAQVLAALRLFNSAVEAAGCCGPTWKCEPNGALVMIKGVHTGGKKNGN